MNKKNENRKAKIMEAGKKHLQPLKHTEFKCPLCGSIATVCCEDNYIISECHGLCTTRAVERI